MLPSSRSPHTRLWEALQTWIRPAPSRCNNHFAPDPKRQVSPRRGQSLREHAREQKCCGSSTTAAAPQPGNAPSQACSLDGCGSASAWSFWLERAAGSTISPVEARGRVQPLTRHLRASAPLPPPPIPRGRGKGGVRVRLSTAARTLPDAERANRSRKHETVLGPEDEEEPHAAARASKPGATRRGTPGIVASVSAIEGKGVPMIWGVRPPGWIETPFPPCSECPRPDDGGGSCAGSSYNRWDACSHPFLCCFLLIPRESAFRMIPGKHRLWGQGLEPQSGGGMLPRASSLPPCFSWGTGSWKEEKKTNK